MRSSQDITCKLNENNQHDSKSQNVNSRHLQIIQLLKEAKHTPVISSPPPLFPQLPLLRTRAMAIHPSQNPITYIYKQSGELFVDEGQHVDSLDKNPHMIKIGINALAHMPFNVSARRRFKEELSSASQAFFQRSAIKKESISTNNESKMKLEVFNAVRQK